MQKKSDILKMFASEAYSLYEGKDKKKLMKAYIEELEFIGVGEEPDEIKFWEAGYYEGYVYCLWCIANHFGDINIVTESMGKQSKTFTSEQLEKMFKSLLK